MQYASVSDAGHTRTLPVLSTGSSSVRDTSIMLLGGMGTLQYAIRGAQRQASIIEQHGQHLSTIDMCH